MPPLDPEEVAVDLTANLDQFDRRVKQSASNFGREMDRISESAIQTEKTVDSSLGGVGETGARAFRRIDREAKTAGLSVDQYRARLRRVAGAAKDLFERLPEFKDVLGDAPDPQEFLRLRADFVKEILNAEKLNIQSGLPELTDELNAVTGASGSAGAAIRKLAVPLAVAFAAFKTLTFAIKEGIPAYLDQQAALNKFGASLRIAGNLSLVTADQMTELAAAVRDTTLQTEESALQAAQSLAQVPGLTVTAMEQALGAAARFADVMDTDVASVISDVVSPAFIALADNDVDALYKSLQDLNPTLARTVIELADAGKTAEAQQVLINGLSDAAGEGPNGLTTNTDRLKDTWEDLKRSLGEDIAGPVTTMLTAIADTLDFVREKARDTRDAIQSLADSGGIGGALGEAIQASFPSLKVEAPDNQPGFLPDFVGLFNETARAARAAADRQFLRDRFEKRDTPRGRRGPTAEQLAEREARRREAFLSQLESLQDSEADARRALIASAQEIAAFELLAVELSRKRYNDNLDRLVEQERLTDEEASQLRDINDERAELRAELVRRREQQRQFRIQEAAAERGLQVQQDQIAIAGELLESQAAVARTARERKEIEDRLITLDFQEERLQLRFVIAQAERLKLELERIRTQRALSDAEKQALQNALDNAALAQGRLGTSDEREANARAGNEEANASPLQRFFGDIPNDAAEINEALESVAAGGLTSLIDGLTQAAVNFRSLKEVGLATLQGITAAIVKLALQQIVLRTIGNTAGNAAVATTGAQMAAVAASAAPAAALVSLATLGSNLGPASAALVGANALAQSLAVTGALARRDGGPIFGPGGPRDDDVLVAASNGEYMIQASSAQKLGRRALDFMNLTGEVPIGLRDGGAIRQSFSPVNLPSRGGAGGMAELSESSISRLAGVVAQAAGAMPDVKLFPTYDPVAAMKATLSSPGGQRVMFDFLSENNIKVRATLNP